MRALRRCLLLVPLLLLLGAGGGPDDPKADDPGAYDEAYQKDGRYAGTPEALIPYRRMGEVYWKFFDRRTLFRGPGVDRPAPEGLATVKIGVMAPIEGSADVAIGRAILDGITLATEEANARGGHAGRIPYELVVRNDTGLWGASSNTMVELCFEEKVWAVIGSVDAANTHIALRVALKAEVPMINTASTDPTITETAIPFILRCYPDDRQHGYRLARFIFEEEGHRRVAILRVNDKFGRMGVGEFVDAARRLGHPIVMELRYGAGESTFSMQLERIRRANVEAIVLWSAAEDAARIVKQARAAGMKMPILGTDRLLSPAFLKRAGEAAEGVIATSPLPPDSGKAAAAFRERFRKRFGFDPDPFAAYAYDGARITFDSIDAAGLNKVRIRDALAALEKYEGVTGPMHFDMTHNNLGTIRVMQVRDGKFETIAE